ncbi:uncharacterized protein LOC107004289 [Solanum pennellii]|uniref:Uncharacterized protein LOC107004289 n=1 Tax=Solanum pennellii TaxID=28526 RepID=A0ABM1FJZ4_SOLPN|nr:uncharacterized protein LOC107004289 [Solanum pennellii]
MTLKLTSLLFITLSTIAIASTFCLATNDDQRLLIRPNIWTELDPNDPRVVDIAKYAVKEATKRAKGVRVFKYVKVNQASVMHFDEYDNTYDLLVEATEMKSRVTQEYMAFPAETLDKITRKPIKRYLLGFNPTS